MSIEWMQCNIQRRENAAAKLDYRVVHIIAVIAVTILVTQNLLRGQIVDIISKRILSDLRALAVLGFMPGFVLSRLSLKMKRRQLLNVVDKVIAATMSVLLIFGMVKSSQPFRLKLIVILTGIIGGFIVTRILTTKLQSL